MRTQRGKSFTTSPHAPNLGDRAYYHRTLLLNAMEDAGFTNHATEFWHFSAADRYDAPMRREPHALYGAIELRQRADILVRFLAARADPATQEHTHHAPTR
ncbi:M15 family metallopeptidase [Streptomyces sp. NPDC051657]|uniref:M15 family metallopeptidase n=1 Tax=unclassified Streptomyces TaxID=2593676 RepID=UPI003436766F